jgi:hypothetical protein
LAIRYSSSSHLNHVFQIRQEMIRDAIRMLKMNRDRS